MPAKIVVPPLGESVVEATVGRWLKQEGEPVAAGELLVELETDKVNQQVAADDAGVLGPILHPEGDTVHPGEVLATIADGTAGAAKAGRQKSEAREPATDRPNGSTQTGSGPRGVETRGSAGAGPSEPEDRVRASPLAERVAEELDVNLAQVPPTRPGARLTREDVETYAREQASSTPDRPASPAAPTPARPAPPAAGGPPPVGPAGAVDPRQTRQRLSRRRLTIARRLVEAQQTAAMLTTFNEVDMSAVMGVRAKRREAFKERYGVSLGYMSFFSKAVVGALKAFPNLNAELEGDELVLKHHYDLGIALGDPEGLVVPVLRDVDRLTFAQIEQAIADFAKKAKERALSVEDLRGGTFTITNGGVFGSLLSTPILNPPQVGILGMHKIQDRPVAAGGEVVIRPVMYLALTYDHRVVDGREAVQFLVRVKELIEDPERLLLEG
jgi:2-oxoglutarate dehydrogenase E2 component (dihydrolipoamide succinyltransferase)